MRGRWRLILTLCLLAPLLTSGCLAQDFFPEPWVWREAGTVQGSFDGADERAERTVELPPRTDRVRVEVRGQVATGSPNVITSTLGEGPGLNVTVQVAGERSYTYRFAEEGTHEVRDLYPAVDGGPLGVEVTGRGQGSWSVSVEAHQPEFEDYAWWKLWLSWG